MVRREEIGRMQEEREQDHTLTPDLVQDLYLNQLKNYKPAAQVSLLCSSYYLFLCVSTHVDPRSLPDQGRPRRCRPKLHCANPSPSPRAPNRPRRRTLQIRRRGAHYRCRIHQVRLG